MVSFVARILEMLGGKHAFMHLGQTVSIEAFTSHLCQPRRPLRGLNCHHDASLLASLSHIALDIEKAKLMGSMHFANGYVAFQVADRIDMISNAKDTIPSLHTYQEPA